MSDRDLINRLEDLVGRGVCSKFEGDTCVSLDLTDPSSLYGGLIRHHGQEQKMEILGLISRLEGLQSLNLRRNLLRRLPDEMANLRLLEELNLGSNYLGSIPSWVQGFSRLRKLHLGNNDLTILPDFLGQFPQLEYLWLHKNIGLRLESLSVLEPLVHLQLLNLYSLNLHRFPAWMGRFTRLKTLTLWNVGSFDDAFANLQELEYFTDCGCPSMRQLPEVLFQLKNIRMARLFQSNVEDVPETISQWSRLEQLSLYQNQLQRIPDSIRELRNLEKLNLGWNSIRRLPSRLEELPALRWLGVFENPIENRAAYQFPSRVRVDWDWPFTTIQD